MKNDTTIIYLTGKPGVGKYTIAKELAKSNDFIICDNQLINNPIFELLQYDGYAKIPEFAWNTIRRIRESVFEFLTHTSQNSYVLTNNLYEYEGDRKLYEQVKQIADLRGSIFIPVRLLIHEKEHLKRLVQPERKKRWKSIDPQDAYDQTPLLSISHPHLLELEVTNLSPEDAAEAIIDHMNSLKS